MAVAAGWQALQVSRTALSDVGLVIVATCTAETQIPSAAAEVAYRLGLDAPGAYDLNAGCAGFCYALATARDAVRSGSADAVLVIGAEKVSQWIDWTDRSTCVLFADGAGAAVVARLAPSVTGEHIGPVVWGSVGAMADKIKVENRNLFIRIDGQTVFRWATTALDQVALLACEKAGADPGELAAVIPHQANLRIIQALARKIGAPQAEVADDIITSGNTVAASIPLALSRMIESGRLPSGASA
jgi:3-oxoacyl-[acyl-carrier-protein] synthase III